MDPSLFHMQYSTGAPPDMFDGGGPELGVPHLQLGGDVQGQLPVVAAPPHNPLRVSSLH